MLVNKYFNLELQKDLQDFSGLGGGEEGGGGSKEWKQRLQHRHQAPRSSPQQFSLKGGEELSK